MKSLEEEDPPCKTTHKIYENWENLISPNKENFISSNKENFISPILFSSL